MKTITNNELAKTFSDLVMKGCEAWIEAGKIAADQLDKDPGWADEVAKLPPYPTAGVVRTFARVGRMQLHPQLMAPGPIGLRKLSKLPYTLQEKHLKEPVNVLVENGETLLIDVHNLTENQAAQVFNNEDIRSIPEQRAWLSNKAVSKGVPPSRSNLPYRVVGKKLVCMNACTIERSEILKLLVEME